MGEAVVALAVIGLFIAGIAGYLKIPEGATGRIFALLISLGLAVEVVRIGINYWLDQQTSSKRASERKEDKKFQDNSLEAHEKTIGSTNRIEHKLDKALTPSQEKELVARYPGLLSELVFLNC
jgi:hypothetical protein